MSENEKTITLRTSDLLSVRDVAQLLGKPRSTVYRWIDEGKLLAVRLGGVLFIPKNAIDKLRPVR